MSKKEILISELEQVPKRWSLKQPSNIRPNRIFTADSHIILYSVGSIKAGKLAEVVDKAIAIIQGKA